MDMSSKATGAAQPEKRAAPEAVIRARRESMRDAADIRAFVLRLLLTALCLFTAFTFIFGIHVLESDEMKPALKQGDMALFYRIGSSYEQGDVVVYEAAGERRVGRVIAKGGDSIDFKDGVPVVNGFPLTEDDIYFRTNIPDGRFAYPMTLSEGQVFILSDYRGEQNDSRSFGPVDKGAVKGVVILALRRPII